MRKEGVQGNWSFGLLWIIVNTFSWGIVFLVGGASAWIVWQFYQNPVTALEFLLFENESTRTLIALVISGLCWGAIVGGLQQALLGRRFELKGKSWVFATMVGLLLYLAFLFLPSSFQFLMRFPLYFSLIGILLNIAYTFVPPLALGVAQWFVLRRYFTRSEWWIVATTLALSLGTYITSWLEKLLILKIPMEYHPNVYLSVVAFFVEGLFYGIASWIVLAFISRHPVAAVEKV
jgi:hypothetical protein